MNNSIKFFAVLSIAFFCLAKDAAAQNRRQRQAAQEEVKITNDIKLLDSRDSLSYVIGFDIARSLITISAGLNTDILAAAIIENLDGTKEPKIDEETALEILTAHFTRMAEEEARRRAEMYRQNDSERRRQETNRIRRQIENSEAREY